MRHLVWYFINNFLKLVLNPLIKFLRMMLIQYLIYLTGSPKRQIGSTIVEPFIKAMMIQQIGIIILSEMR